MSKERYAALSNWWNQFRELLAGQQAALRRFQRESEYPEPPAECPFWKDSARITWGPMWAGAAAARAFADAIGVPSNGTLYEYWTRKHPNYQRMLEMEKLQRSPAPKA